MGSVPGRRSLMNRFAWTSSGEFMASARRGGLIPVHHFEEGPGIVEPGSPHGRDHLPIPVDDIGGEELREAAEMGGSSTRWVSSCDCTRSLVRIALASHSVARWSAPEMGDMGEGACSLRSTTPTQANHAHGWRRSLREGGYTGWGIGTANDRSV